MMNSESRKITNWSPPSSAGSCYGCIVGFNCIKDVYFGARGRERRRGWPPPTTLQPPNPTFVEGTAQASADLPNFRFRQFLHDVQREEDDAQHEEIDVSGSKDQHPRSELGKFSYEYVSTRATTYVITTTHTLIAACTLKLTQQRSHADYSTRFK